MLHTCTTVYFHYWRWKWSNYFVNNTSVSPLVKRNYEETLHTNPVYITLYHKFYVTLISVCSIAVALVIQWHLLDHIPLTYQFFCISVSFHQTSAGFEVGFHSRSGRYHCGSRRQTQKDVRDNYACNSIKMKHSASIIFCGVLAHHIQHSNKLINSCQHFFQALLQTQDLEEKSLKKNTVKMLLKLCRNQSYK